MFLGFLRKNIHSQKALVLKNIFYAGLGQGLNYIVPLLVITTLVQRLGLSKVGNYAIINNLFNFIALVVGFGFNLSTIRHLMQDKSRSNLTILFSQITYSRIFNGAFGIIISLILLCFYKALLPYYQVSALSIIIYTVGCILFNDWLIIGMQKAEVHFAGLILSKFMYLYIIYYTDYIYAFEALIILEAFSMLILGLASFLLLKNKYHFSIKCVPLTDIIKRWLESLQVFSAYLFVFFYSSINIFFLSWINGNEITGLYSIIDRVYIILTGIFAIILRSLFPYLSSIYTENKKKYYNVFSDIFYKLILFMTIFILLIYSLRSFIITIITKSIVKIEYIEVVNQLFPEMLLAVFIHTCASYLSYSFYIVKNEKKLLKYFLFVAVINLLIATPIIREFTIHGIPYLLLINYSLILLLEYKEFSINKLNLK